MKEENSGEKTVAVFKRYVDEPGIGSFPKKTRLQDDRRKIVKTITLYEGVNHV
jgi:hypothetical protein